MSSKKTLNVYKYDAASQQYQRVSSQNLGEPSAAGQNAAKATAANRPTPGVPRPDLQAVELTLPPFVEGRDRPVHFEADGSIVYDKAEGDWEPPRDIDGYQRDPTNAWRFLPQWPVCRARIMTAVRLVNCGCIGLITRCNHPQTSTFTQQVFYDQCKGCQDHG